MTTKSMETAEWMCTACDVTNRKLVRPDEDEVQDRCVTCHTRHVVTRDRRPVRWKATAKR